ncbi:MASE1 domain-containing protein [Cupriavidus agavae]|uniref:Integral membrane sensor domain MASE1 n=1 Tax=Cupriavidus agavae TaxID=1001822 RepID=A0A4V2FEY3_9BURK|nr:MASE1 domain-containing protein [Cupriavidus agavae]RZT31379.1 integral membrane sensor domain MASE1 [Cupriavidus agavae]
MQSAGTRFVVVATLVAVAYLAIAVLSGAMAASETQAVAVWLASGVSFGAWLVCAPGRRLAVLAGTAVASLLWGLAAHDLDAGASLAFAAIETGSIALGAAIAARGQREPPQPLLQAALMVVGAMVTGAVGATLANEFWRWLRPGNIAFAAEWRAWAFSTVVGILLVAPVITGFRGFAVKRSGGMPMKQFGAGAGMFGLFLLTTLVVFHPSMHERFDAVAPTLTYLPMPFLLLASMFWGPRGGSVATLLGAVLIIWLTANGGGPFTINEGFQGEAVIEVQAYVWVWAVLLLVGRALNEARRLALTTAREWQLRYERTLHATGVASVEFDAVTGAAVWGESAEAVLGAEATQLRNIRDWLDRVDIANRPFAQAGWDAVASGQRDTSSDAYEVHLDGRDVHIQARLAPVRGPDGAVERVACLLRMAAPAGAGVAGARHA